VVTFALAATGAVLLAAAIVAPVSLLWAPGFLLLGLAWQRHQTRHARAALRRAGRRRGYISR
jgi:hypothetical protein